MILGEQELNVMVAASHDGEPPVVVVEVRVVSFDVDDASRLVEEHCDDDLAREPKTALLRPILETRGSMGTTMDLTRSHDVEHRSFDEEIEVRIVGVREGLKDMIVQRLDEVLRIRTLIDVHPLTVNFLRQTLRRNILNVV